MKENRHMNESNLKGYFPRVIPAVVTSFILGAHFMRRGQPGLVAIALLSPLLLIFRQKWTLRVYQLLLFTGTIRWIQITMILISDRSSNGQPWTRAAVIMGSVALFMLISALFLYSGPFRERHNRNNETVIPSVASFIAVIVLSSFPHIKMEYPIPLIAERLLPGSGWIEIVLLGLYAGWLSGKLAGTRDTSSLRSKVWTFFSVVFFLQLVVGISGFPLFLMTGKLHLPVPAMIIAGPVYRGVFSFFMPILLLITIVVAGPAWCSWFCYFGNWDLIASRTARAGKFNRTDSLIIRLGILIILMVTAFLLDRSRTSGVVAITGGSLFGLIGIGVMVVLSRKKGVMYHCTHYCPIGLVTTFAGKVNPFRIKIDNECTECQSCVKSCRYGALTPERIRKKHPGITCTLCGDCISACPAEQIEYRFPGLKPQTARTFFLVTVVVIHTLFLGFGRI